MVVKKQHYVPRFYLKNFTDNPKQIGMYNFKSSRVVNRSNLYNQCCKDFFYDEDNRVENSLAEVEKIGSNVIKKIIKDKSLDNFTSDDRFILDFYISVQRQRTMVSAEQVNQFYNLAMKNTVSNQRDTKPIMDPKLYNIVVNDAVHHALKLGCTASPLLIDLKLKLLINTTEHSFITSDHPVIFTNPLLETFPNGSSTGYATVGLIIIFPISSDLCLIMYDYESYFIGDDKNDVVIDDTLNIHEINVSLMTSANENVYFNPNMSTDYVHRLRKSSKWSSSRQHGEIHIQPEKNGSRLISFTQKESVKNFNLKDVLVVKKNKKKWLKKLQNKRHVMMSYIRNEALYHDHDQFSKLVNKGHYQPGDFFKFMSHKYDR